MPWKRGNRDADTELANLQSWVEMADPIFFGKNGDSGMVRLFYDDRAAQMQKEKDVIWLLKVIAWCVGPVSGLGFIVGLVNLYLHLVGK